MRDDLGIRMKEFYEKIPNTKLMRRVPVIIRLDGRSFHSFTRGFQKPFDDVLIAAMQETMRYLCENIQGCVFGYTQSDEITLVLTDYETFETSAWFDYKVQKLCSIAASMATMTFNKALQKELVDFEIAAKSILFDSKPVPFGEIQWPNAETAAQYATYKSALNRGAMFDARCFNVPKEEVVNCIYWRQLDATRNSIQMVGQAYFSHKELDHKSQNDIQNMLLTEKDINWNDFPTHKRRGSCCIKDKYALEDGTIRSRWIIDEEIPIFKNEGREYIERLI